MTRPTLDKFISIDDFKNQYWLKSELASFCRINQIPVSGGKIELESRIVKYLETSEIARRPTICKSSNFSNFNWSKEQLTLETILTDNYSNTENVRSFFVKNIGNHFHFFVEFMVWMKKNNGKTLHDAIDEWNKIYKLKSNKTIITEIAPQFEYNRYIRDIMANNKEIRLKDAIKCWKYKRNLRGCNVYESSDLLCLNHSHNEL